MTPAQIKEWRTAHGLTQQAMADLLGVRCNTVSRWEQGSTAAPAMLADALAEIGRKLAGSRGGQ